MKRNIRMSDSAASGVTRAAEIEEEETCDMHDGGKVGQSAMVSYSATSGVSRAVKTEEEETCGMHDGGKVGQSATGRLVRTPSTWPWSVVDLTQTRDFSESEEEGE
jgi:hypothetical protein